MKKIILVTTLIITEALMISGCGGSNESSSITTSNLCNDGYDLVYAINTAHPSASLSSSSNKVYINTICQRDKSVEVIKKNYVGSFTDSPSKYKMYYSSNNRPAYGYDTFDYYSGTEYNGLNERYMYASKTKAELNTKVKNDIYNNDCKRYAANTSGGNLESHSNFWVYFCPKEDLIANLNLLD